MAGGGSKAGSAAIIYLVLAGLQRGVAILLLPFISRAMSPVEYGAASMLTVSSLLVTAIVAAPLEQFVFRAGVRSNPGSRRQLYAAGIYAYFLMPACMALAAAACFFWLPTFLDIPGYIWAIEILAIGLLGSVTYYALPLVRSRHALGRFVVLASVSIVLTAIGKFLFVIHLELGVLGWALSDLLVAAVGAATAMIVSPLRREKISREDVREVAAFAVPLVPHRASFWALSSLSRPTLAIVSTLTQVGFIAFGLNLAAVANLFLAEINRAVLPHYSKETLPAPTRETMLVARLQVVSAIGIPAFTALGIALAGGWLIDAQYWPAFGISAILLLGQFAYGVYLIPMNYIVQTAGAPKYSSIASVFGAAIILTGTLVTGSAFGALGVAVATTLGFTAMTVIAFVLLWRLRIAVRWRNVLPGPKEAILGLVALAFCVWSCTPEVYSTTTFYLAAIGVSALAVYLAVALRKRPVS